MAQRKNIKIGKVNFLFISFFYFIFINNISADNLLKTETIAELKVLKCYNSKFDDDPEVTAYMQVIDKTVTNNDKVFIFNDWTFASSPSIRPFDHPVYDVWLKKCYS